MTYEKLFAACSIFSSDDDQPTVEDLTIGYDQESRALIVLLEHTNYEDHGRDSATWAEVDKEEALRLARRLGVGMVDLPGHISECMTHPWADIINPSLQDVRDCFADVLNRLVDEHCRYTLRHERARG